jgi:DNA polymerase III delta prime subunit
VADETEAGSWRTIADLTDRNAVEVAIREYDDLGGERFRRKYGFKPSQKYRIRYDGKLYDIKPVLAAAYSVQYPDRSPLTSQNSTSGLRTTVPKAQELGFEVDGIDELVLADSAFIFQANPAYYDISAAVRELDQMNWSVRQSTKQIHAGDRVYIWESGPSGGVIAEGRILTDPAVMPTQEGPQFILQPERFEGEDLRVQLSIDRVIDPPIYRSRLLEHTTLKDLGIIKFSNATNYRISEEADAALQALIDGDDQPESLDALVEEWREETNYPTPHDLAKKAEREELAAALTAESLDLALADPEERFALLKFTRLAGGAYGGAGNQSVVQKHINQGPDAKTRVVEALHHLLYDSDPVSTRLDDVILKDEWHPPGFGEAVATKALAVLHPDHWLPLYQYGGRKGKLRLMESPELEIEIPEDLEEWPVGRRIEWSNDTLRARMEPLIPGDPWGQMVFLYWLRDRHSPAVGGTPSLVDLAGELMVEPEWLERIVDLLEEKRQVIFQGPPGTGKTYVARRLGRYFEEQGGRTETVQFHPSYSYEDFVEGYRPTVIGNQPGFELAKGPLRRLATDAELDPANKYILIIDELNRGNVAKIFGELYFLLEYRSERIRLQYGKSEEEDGGEASYFSLPKNLWIIGTMNTADRSIALMDAALRRRFYFVDYYPDQPPIEGLLDRWLERNELDEYGWVPRVLERANAKLGESDAAIGPSHFLLRDPGELDEERIERIWSHGVLPYLQERLMGQPDRMREFDLDLLREEEEKEDMDTSAAQSDPPDQIVP